MLAPEGEGSKVAEAAPASNPGSQPKENGSGELKGRTPVVIIVMGVSGSGKSTLGAALAEALGLPFLDADSLHPKENIDKMSSGMPLTDDDRAPWLRRVRERAVEIAEENAEDQTRDKLEGVVVGCSALKRVYREFLRGNDVSEGPGTKTLAELPTFIVYIKGERQDIWERMTKREGHFFKAAMLDSQFDALQTPEGEDGVIVVSLLENTEEQVARAKEGLRPFVSGLD